MNDFHRVLRSPGQFPDDTKAAKSCRIHYQSMLDLMFDGRSTLTTISNTYKRPVFLDSTTRGFAWLKAIRLILISANPG